MARALQPSIAIHTAQLGITLALGSFAGIMACLEFGYRLGRRHSKQTAHEGIGAIEAAVFALLGLLLAFSFAGGTSRLDAPRQLIVEEANAIGTAYLRMDMLATADQPEMRRLFQEYLDARLQVYQKLPNSEAAEQQMKLAAAIQQKLWSQAVNASRANTTPAVAMLVLPAINQMIDVTTSCRVALYTHLPSLVLPRKRQPPFTAGLIYPSARPFVSSHAPLVPWPRAIIGLRSRRAATDGKEAVGKGETVHPENSVAAA